MLVITLLEGKRIRLLLPDGREIWLKNVRDKRYGIRLGIEAPDDVKIEREEVIARPAVGREGAPGVGSG